jgi:hypothetical protein
LLNIAKSQRHAFQVVDGWREIAHSGRVDDAIHWSCIHTVAMVVACPLTSQQLADGDERHRR